MAVGRSAGAAVNVLRRVAFDGSAHVLHQPASLPLPASGKADGRPTGRWGSAPRQMSVPVRVVSARSVNVSQRTWVRSGGALLVVIGVASKAPRILRPMWGAGSALS